MSQCPIFAIVDAKAKLDKLKFLEKNFQAVFLMKLFGIVAPFAEDIISGVMDIEDSANAIFDSVNTLISGVSGDKWMNYAASQNAKEAISHLDNEISMLSSIITDFKAINKLSPLNEEQEKQANLIALSNRIWDIAMTARKLIFEAGETNDIQVSVSKLQSSRNALATAQSLLDGDNKRIISNKVKAVLNREITELEYAIYSKINDESDTDEKFTNGERISPRGLTKKERQDLWKESGNALQYKKANLDNKITSLKVYSSLINKYIGINFDKYISEYETSDIERDTLEKMVVDWGIGYSTNGGWSAKTPGYMINDLVKGFVNPENMWGKSFTHIADWKDTVFFSEVQATQALTLFLATANATVSGYKPTSSSSTFDRDDASVLKLESLNVYLATSEYKRGTRNGLNQLYIQNELAKSTKLLDLRIAISALDQKLFELNQGVIADKKTEKFNTILIAVGKGIRSLNGEDSEYDYVSLYDDQNKLYKSLNKAYHGSKTTAYREATTRKESDDISIYYDWAKSDMDKIILTSGLGIISGLAGPGLGSGRVSDKDLAIIEFRINVLRARRNALSALPEYQDDSITAILDLIDGLGMTEVSDTLKNGKMILNDLSAKLAVVGNFASIADAFASCLEGVCLKISDRRYVQKWIDLTERYIRKAEEKVVKKTVDFLFEKIGLNWNFAFRLNYMGKLVAKMNREIDKLTALEDSAGWCETKGTTSSPENIILKGKGIDVKANTTIGENPFKSEFKGDNSSEGSI